MATRPETVEFILKIGDAGDVSAREMFGEYGVYANGKFIAVICDDLFHVKPTDAKAVSVDLEMGSHIQVQSRISSCRVISWKTAIGPRSSSASRRMHSRRPSRKSQSQKSLPDFQL